MKKYIVIFIVMSFATTISFSQTTSLNAITENYLQIKNALSNDDANNASNAAQKFKESVSNIDMKAISDKLHPTFMQNKISLEKYSQAIAENKDIKIQRKFFIELSKNILALAKTDKISNQSLYEDYCPMKKSSWLSEDKEIKNPFYGSSMLSCGKITANY